jgi:PAS domain S-box-containing protein
MVHALGPRTGRIYELLLERIRSGELQPGTRLPPHTRLATDFGVAPMTIRTVLARLEADGLVSRELGRGTFVRGSARPAVLVLAAPHLQAVLGEHVHRLGYPLIAAVSPEDALATLSTNRAVGLVLCELPTARAGRQADLLRAVRRRWPRLPVAVVTSSAANLATVLGTPEGPVLLVPTPVRASQLEEVVRLALADPGPLLDDVFARLPDPALVLDRATRRVTAWNPAAELLLGYPRTEAVGMPLEMLVPLRVMAELNAGAGPPDTSLWDPILDATEPFELPLVRADGREVWVELAVSTLSNQHVLVVGRDRTAPRTTHDSLSFRAQLLEAVEQAVIATDPYARILYWNRGAERLYGWRAEEVLGRNAGEVIVAPELMARGLEIMGLLREGKSWTGEFPVRRRDGTEIPVLVTDSPIRDIDGRLVGIIGVAVDLTERKQAEYEKLERGRLEAVLLATAAAQRELSAQLASNVPSVGRLAGDPRLPPHLRPIAGSVLEAVREVVTRLEHSAELPGTA